MAAVTVRAAERAKEVGAEQALEGLRLVHERSNRRLLLTDILVPKGGSAH
ncbi:hypothetical protein [Streptomyces griseoaurantiacus]